MMINWIKVSFFDVRLDSILISIVVTTNVAPWIKRASDIKAEVVVNHELEHKLQQHNDEIIKLIKDVRMKDQSLQESDVKISLLEKRMEVAKKEMEQIKSLEDDLEKSMNQEQMYAEAMENLQNEYDQLEIENNQLKKEANKREEKRQSILRKANFDLTEGEDSEHMQEMAGGYYEMAGHMETLKASIRYLRAENAQLKSADFCRSLDLVSSAPIIKNQPRNEMMTDIARETRVLVKDMRIASASPRIIQLAPVTSKWSSIKKSPDYQYQTQQSVLYTLKQRSVQLRRKVDDLQITTDKFPTINHEKVIYLFIYVMLSTVLLTYSHAYYRNHNSSLVLLKFRDYHPWLPLQIIVLTLQMHRISIDYIVFSFNHKHL